MYKTIILFIFYLTSPQTLLGQLNKNYISNNISNSQYIFEGLIIAQVTFQDSLKSGIFTSSLIKINKILKGNLNCSFVEIIAEGGRYKDQELISSHALLLRFGNTGIFFCNDLNFILLSTNVYSNYSNLKKLQFTNEFAFLYSYNLQKSNDTIGILTIDSLNKTSCICKISNGFELDGTNFKPNKLPYKRLLLQLEIANKNQKKVYAYPNSKYFLIDTATYSLIESNKKKILNKKVAPFIKSLGKNYQTDTIKNNTITYTWNTPMPILFNKPVEFLFRNLSITTTNKGKIIKIDYILVDYELDYYYYQNM